MRPSSANQLVRKSTKLRVLTTGDERKKRIIITTEDEELEKIVLPSLD